MDEQTSLDFQQNDGPVEVLGMTFENDDARREYFRNELRIKLPELKKIEGFPIGGDEDIIALSDPPYYTACPNPWIDDFVNLWQHEDEEYHREPYAADVTEGKTDAIYLAHSYHTKVPHKAIMRYLEHYTNPGDLIIDGFAGTGMTGIAGTLMNNKDTMLSMGYSDKEVEATLGLRHVILNDLSPLASFVSYNYSFPMSADEFELESNKILNVINSEFGWMYETNHVDSNGNIIGIGTIKYTVLSDVFECPSCNSEVVFTDVALNGDGSVNKTFKCTNCGTELTKNKMEKIFVSEIDANGNLHSIAKQIPVMINYDYSGNNYTKKLDENDFDVIKKINDYEISSWFPDEEIPDGEEIARVKRNGIDKVYQFYSKRALIILSKVYELLNSADYKDSKFLWFVFEQAVLGMSKIARYVPTHFSQVNQYLSGTLYIGSQIVDVSLDYIISGKVKRVTKMLQDGQLSRNDTNVISTQAIQSLTDTMPANSIDYIFTDPPFGANLMYSDLNFLWESWLKVKTSVEKETIVNKVQNKDIDSYKQLMVDAFAAYYKVLKPDRWMTVEFSNSKASVWNSIQEAIQQVGFVIANVSALDKKQGSFKALMSTTAVKQDLVISVYKPSEKNIMKMQKEDNHVESAWTFVGQHLDKLPVFIGEKGSATIIAERTPRILFDRMVAFHVQHGLHIPISSAEFQTLVSEQYPMRDGMAFLDSQVAEYDKKRLVAKEFSQQSLFVSDENSAIEWLRQKLMKKPQTRQDIQPDFMKEIQHIASYEELPELDDLLEQNFLMYDGEEKVPAQIRTYLTQTYHELRGKDDTDIDLTSKATNRWYVPDPNKQADLEKLRERTLLREFDHYVEVINSSKKKLKTFRTEAIRVGFKKAWGDKDYQTIVSIGDKLPEKVIQEDDKLLMYYDNAVIRTEM